VSVPIVTELADPKVVLGFDGTKWSRYLPGTGYVNYGDDPEHLTWFDPAASVPGRGYWGSWAQDVTLEVSGTPLPLTGAFSIDLATGWNLIGNPWQRVVPWDAAAINVTLNGETKTLAQAALAGWVLDYAWTWTPNTQNPTTGQYWMVATADIGAAKHQLDPYQGYWVKAVQPCTLVLPAPAKTITPPPSRRAGSQRLFAQGWQFQLIASAPSGEDGFNWLGVGAGEQIARANRILNPPASPVPSVELNFLGGQGGRSIDLRDISQPNPTWRFTVTSPNPGEPVTLRWPDMTAVPGDLGLTLVNEQTGERRYLRTTRDYSFAAPADGTAATFHIEVVPRGTLRVLSFNARPADGRAGGVHIQYTLTQEAAVVVEIRSATGRLVRHLTAARAPSNTPSSIIWDGRSDAQTALPRGNYLVTLTAAGSDGRTVRAVTMCNTHN
ncbi:MAG TPA: FlgD immunoglobulin-like domain containing protein, partial [Armatimonadota bacterium]